MNGASRETGWRIFCGEAHIMEGGEAPPGGREKFFKKIKILY